MSSETAPVYFSEFNPAPAEKLVGTKDANVFPESLLDEKQKVEVLVGHITVDLERMQTLKTGEVLDFDADPGSRVFLQMNGVVFAAGVLVVVENKLGVLIQHLGAKS